MFESSERLSFGICTIATNDYVYFWKDLVTSAQKAIESTCYLKFHVFTDQSEVCREFANEIKKFQIEVHKIPKLMWPEATLDRYRIFEEFKDTLVEDVLIHIDADMIIKRDFIEKLHELELDNDITLVSHPGYWRPSNGSGYPINFLSFIRYLRIRFCYGSLGTWETRKKSTAYVPRKMRKKYVCGGVWMGQRDAFIRLCTLLKENVIIDNRNGIVAQWHDESHLNKWASINKYNCLPPSFCYSNDFKHLSALTPIIEAVTKNKSFSELKKKFS